MKLNKKIKDSLIALALAIIALIKRAIVSYITDVTRLTT